MANEEYVPGVCNIGTEEIAKRKQVGWIGLIISIVLFGVLMYAEVNRWWRLFLFLPVALCAVGFLQARARFCYAYGVAGIFSLGAPGKGKRVHDDAARMLDRKRANQIILYTILIGAAVALIAVVV